LVLGTDRLFSSPFAFLLVPRLWHMGAGGRNLSPRRKNLSTLVFISRGLGLLPDVFRFVNHFKIHLYRESSSNTKKTTTINNIFEGWLFTSRKFPYLWDVKRYPIISPHPSELSTTECGCTGSRESPRLADSNGAAKQAFELIGDISYTRPAGPNVSHPEQMFPFSILRDNLLPSAPDCPYTRGVEC